MQSHDVFITGGTGYVGGALIPALAARGHAVRALVRPGSGRKLARGASAVAGNALDAASFRTSIAPADTLIHLVGTPHPSPSKAQQFRDVDLASITAAVEAAKSAHVRHFVYLSVAHPAPVMAAYIAVREAGEALVRSTGIAATILRPWYVLGPGHYWPLALLPAYWVMEAIPATRESARRLGLVRLREMVGAIVHAVENPPAGVRVLNVPDIRAAAAR
jgi:uncharacterized protein YbjT (DUF2867 family)